eukprot:6708705-Karenia_brevis.AAC.1
MISFIAGGEEQSIYILYVRFALPAAGSRISCDGVQGSRYENCMSFDLQHAAIEEVMSDGA